MTTIATDKCSEPKCVLDRHALGPHKDARGNLFVPYPPRRFYTGGD